MMVTFGHVLTLCVAMVMTLTAFVLAMRQSVAFVRTPPIMDESPTPWIPVRHRLTKVAFPTRLGETIVCMPLCDA